jgi:heat shock protein HslJ
MKRFAAALALAMAACSPQGELPADMGGRWDVQQIAGASLGEGVDIWIEIDAASGDVSGFTGCNNFTASMSAFSEALTIGSVTEEAGVCADAAAATDEARFLGVLPAAQRRIRHGRSLELLAAASGSEALLRLRLGDEVGG